MSDSSEISQLTCMFVDTGLFLPVARRLARDYKRVLFHRPNDEGFPTINSCIIGDGFPDIEKCDDLWRHKDKADVFVFTNINKSDLQLELERQGKKVWGSRAGDSLEIMRRKFHSTLERLGLDVPEFTVVKGLNKLRDHLKPLENLYVKISRYRGSLETFHWRSWSLDEGWLDVLAVKFGPAKELIPFLVFDPIETPLEIGGDTYCVDGKWPDKMLHGIEKKDAAYFAAMTPFDEMPAHLVEIMEAFSPELAKCRYRNEWSMEVRVKDDKAFFTDPTCRGGLPSTASQLEIWENFAEIVWAGANGELVQPKPLGKFSAEIVLKSQADKGEWAAVELPGELEQWAKLSNCCLIDGRVCFPPNDCLNDIIGWLVAIGDTPQETLDRIKEYAKLIPEGVTADVTPLEDIFAEIEEEEKAGIKFTEKPLPTPEEVIS